LMIESPLYGPVIVIPNPFLLTNIPFIITD
jgi:hypothetical protein